MIGNIPLGHSPLQERTASAVRFTHPFVTNKWARRCYEKRRFTSLDAQEKSRSAGGAFSAPFSDNFPISMQKDRPKGRSFD